MSCFLYMFFFQRYGDHRDLHLLTHSCPTRRSSDLADRRRVLERLDATEADMVRAAVGAVDDGVGFTGELVLKALVHQTPDDGRAACAGVDHIIGDAAILPALGEDAVHRLDAIASHSDVQERETGLRDNKTLDWH